MGKDMEPVKKLKERLKDLASLIEREPFILLKDGKDFFISEPAKNILSNKKICRDELLEWLKIGAQHLLNTHFCGMELIMMRFPDQTNDVLVILREDHGADQKQFNLTPKEREILSCLIKGLTNKEIAASLNISPGTVNTHLDSIYNKLGVSSRLAASFTALKNGLVVPKSI